VKWMQRGKRMRRDALRLWLQEQTHGGQAALYESREQFRCTICTVPLPCNRHGMQMAQPTRPGPDPSTHMIVEVPALNLLLSGRYLRDFAAVFHARRRARVTAEVNQPAAGAKKDIAAPSGPPQVYSKDTWFNAVCKMLACRSSRVPADYGPFKRPFQPEVDLQKAVEKLQVVQYKRDRAAQRAADLEEERQAVLRQIEAALAKEAQRQRRIKDLHSQWLEQDKAREIRNRETTEVSPPEAKCRPATNPAPRSARSGNPGATRPARQLAPPQSVRQPAARKDWLDAVHECGGIYGLSQQDIVRIQHRSPWVARPGDIRGATPRAKAKKAGNCLTEAAIEEFRSLELPPAECVDVGRAVLSLINRTDVSEWKEIQVGMSSPSSILNKVRTFDPDSVPERVFSGLGDVLARPSFNYASMRGRSRGAAHLCDWVLAVVACHQGRTGEERKTAAAVMNRVDETSGDSNGESLSESGNGAEASAQQKESDEEAV